MFSLRIVNVDHYMCAPKPGLDVTYSQFRGSQVKLVPVIRIFGSTATGCKTCLHVHGVFPYVLVPFSGGDNPGKAVYLLASSLDKAINISLGSSNSNKQHVFKIVQVSGRPFYGYHSQEHQFLKIFFYNPLIIKRASDLLQNGAVCGTKFQLHESHVPFILQFFIDYNLYGMSFINLKSVIFREHANPAGVTPGTISRESVSELEADAVAVDILNRLIVEGELAVNPGLAAIWKEEKERLNTDEMESSQRPTQHTAMSEVFFRDKLIENLQFQGTCKSFLKEIIPYPAETQRTVNNEIVNASVLDTHSMSSLALLNVTSEETPVVDEELVLNISQQLDTLHSLDQSLLVALDNLAEHNVKPLSQNVDDDSVLGSQILSPERNCDLQDFSENIKSPAGLSLSDITLISRDGDSEDGVDDKIPQLDGIGDISTTKKRKSERIAKKVLIDNAAFENSQPFETSDMLLNDLKDSSCWPESGKDESLDEIFSDDEPFNSPIHNFEEGSTAHNDQVAIDSINTFDTVLRGDPSFSSDEVAVTEDVFLQSKNESVTWNSLDVDDISDKKFDCSNLFNTTPDVSLKSILDNSSPQISKNEKIVQICKNKCPSNNTVPLPSNNLEGVDSEKSVSLPSCSEDLFNTLQLDEMFDQDLNKGLEIIYKNNSQSENITNELRLVRHESPRPSSISHDKEHIMEEQTIFNNNVFISDKEIVTDISKENSSNEYFNDIFNEEKMENHNLWEDKINCSDILCTSLPPVITSSLNNSMVDNHELKLGVTDNHANQAVTPEALQINKKLLAVTNNCSPKTKKSSVKHHTCENTFDNIVASDKSPIKSSSSKKYKAKDQIVSKKKCSIRLNKSKNVSLDDDIPEKISTAKRQSVGSIGDGRISVNNEKTPTKDRQKDNKIYTNTPELSPITKGSPKINKNHTVEQKSPKKLKTKKIDHKLSIKLFAHQKAPDVIPNTYKMTRNEIERYFLQIEAIAAKMSSRGHSNSNEIIKWTPLRNPLDDKIVKSRKKKSSVSKEKPTITNKNRSNGDIYNLKSCYVKLQKLNKQELKSLCNTYKIIIMKNAFKNFKNCTKNHKLKQSLNYVKKGIQHEIRSNKVVSQRKENREMTSVQVDKHNKNNSEISIVSEVFVKDCEGNYGFKAHCNILGKDKMSCSTAENSKLNTNCKSSANSLDEIKKFDHNIDDKLQLQKTTSEKPSDNSQSLSLKESCSSSNELCKTQINNHTTENEGECQTKKSRQSLKKRNINNLENQLKLKRSCETDTCLLNEPSCDLNGISNSTKNYNKSKCFKNSLNSKNNLNVLVSNLENYELYNDNLKNKVKHKKRKREKSLEKNKCPENGGSIKTSSTKNVQDYSSQDNISYVDNINSDVNTLEPNIPLCEKEERVIKVHNDSRVSKECQDLLHIVEPSSLVISETNNNFESLCSNKPKLSTLSVCIPKLKERHFKDLSKKIHCDKKRSRISHSQSSEEVTHVKKKVSPYVEQNPSNTSKSKSSFITKTKAVKHISNNKKLKNATNPLKLNRSNSNPPTQCNKNKFKRSMSLKNKLLVSNNIKSEVLNGTCVTDLANSTNLVAVDISPNNLNQSATYQKENMDNIGQSQTNESDEMNQENKLKVPVVQVIKLSDHEVGNIKKSSIKDKKAYFPSKSKITKDDNFRRKKSLTEDNNVLLNNKSPPRIYSLDGTVDNSSSSDENIEEKSCPNAIASTSHCLTPPRRKRESEQNRKTPKNNYVPLDIEIKKSPKCKLLNNKKKESLFARDLTDFKSSSTCNSNENLENDERKRLDPYIKVQRISLPSKPDKCISNTRNIKIGQSTSTATNDEPVVKKLKVSIQRLSFDSKGETNEHKKPVVPSSSQLPRLSSSVTTISKNDNQVADISIDHSKALQERDGNFQKDDTEKGNKVRKALMFSEVNKDNDWKIDDYSISVAPLKEFPSRKLSIDLFEFDGSPESKDSTIILTNERSSNLVLNQNPYNVSAEDQSGPSGINECMASNSSLNDLNYSENLILDTSLQYIKPLTLGSNSQELSNSTFMPVIEPPTRSEIVMNIKKLGIREVINEEPFYSNPHDIEKSSEIGSTMLKLKSKSVVHLEEYEGTFQGISKLKKKKDLLNMQRNFSDTSRLVTITPLMKPPSALDAKQWLNNKICSVNNKLEVLKKDSSKIVIPKSPQHLIDDDEDDHNMTISQSTPISKTSFNETEIHTALSTPQDNSYKHYIISPVMSSTPLLPKALLSKKSSKGLLRSSIGSSLTTIREESDCMESPPLSQSSCCSKVEPASGSEPALSETAVNRILTETKSPACVSGLIDIATPNNSGNYRLEYENLQDIKTTHDHQHLTLMAMELHIHTRGELRPNPDHDAICCIFYSINNDVPDSSISNVSGVIYVTSDEKQMKMPQFQCEKLAVIDEHALIIAFVELVRKWDPDIFVGYEIEMLSWGFLLQRAYQLNINLISELSRINCLPQTGDQGIKKDGGEIRFTGRIVLDLWRFLRHEVALQSYTFENIVYHVLHERVPTFSFQTLAMWWSNRYHQVQRWKVIEHYLIRVKGVIQLMQQLDLVGRTSEFARLFGIQFYEVLSRGSQFRVESMMLRLVKPLNYIAVSPSIQQRAKMRAPESLPLIMEPQSRFYSDPVIVLDFQSLYPSIIIAYNYCYSTCMGRVEHLGRSHLFEFGCTQLKVPTKELVLLQDKINFSPCGVAFVKESVRQGVLPRMLSEILNTRLMVKQSMKQNKDNKTLQRVLHNRQLGLKLIANVTYGYTSANFSGRMPCIEVGDSVVSKARETLERAISLVGKNSQWGARVIYGDTDSMFVLVPGKSREEAFRIGAEIADAVTNDNPKPVKLKLEKVYQPCLLQTKKRYVGYMYESANQETPVYDAKGIETVRRDGCPAVAKILEKSLRILFEKKDVSLIKQYVCQQFSKVMSGRISIQELTFAREYRGAGGYKPGACVPALELAKQWRKTDPRAEPRVGERVPYVIVAGPPGLPLIRLVRSPKHFLSDDSLKINSEYYISRVIIPPLERCFSLIGAQVDSWYAELPRRQHINLPTSVPESSKKATISQYFVTTHCAVCQTVTTGGLCPDCQQRPQQVAVTLSNRVRAWERKQALVNKVCSSCCGRAYETDCISLDCPVIYSRYQASRDSSQANYIYSLLQQFTF